jgi:aspartyl-tRNA(Asn)/glutamyl-tRNA(Gln) amidotransferase subunit A
MDHVGPLARSVEDVALLFGVMAGRSPQRRSEEVRIGVPERYFFDGDADTMRAFEGVVQALGSRIVRVKLPRHFEAGVHAGIVSMYSEMAAVHRERFAANRERYGWKLACLLDAGARVSAADYLRAQQVRRVAAREISGLLAEVDCLLTPTTPAPAPKGLDATGDWRHNLPFSSSGHPALSVPVALSSAGLPIGVQLVAAYGAEERLFQCGELIERAVPFKHQAPCQ